MDGPLDQELIEHYQKQLRSRDEWTTGQLADFFGVSGETIRRRLKDGTITGRQSETTRGKVWTVKTEEIVRNIQQEKQLQRYLKKKLESGHTEATTAKNTESSPQNSTTTESNQDSIVGALVDQVERLQDRLESTRETVEELREQNGSLKERVNNLENENKQLRAELENRPEPNALPAKIEQGRKEVLQQVGKFSTTLRGLIESWMERDS
jgi:regulator of replication initiation timing